MDTIPSIISAKMINRFNHIDFVWGLDAADEVYTDIIDRIVAQENIWF